LKKKFWSFDGKIYPSKMAKMFFLDKLIQVTAIIHFLFDEISCGRCGPAQIVNLKFWPVKMTIFSRGNLVLDFFSHLLVNGVI
jgi:hypothetical protein